MCKLVNKLKSNFFARTIRSSDEPRVLVVISLACKPNFALVVKHNRRLKVFKIVLVPNYRTKLIGPQKQRVLVPSWHVNASRIRNFTLRISLSKFSQYFFLNRLIVEIENSFGLISDSCETKSS